jgi:hypothetical protein
VHFCLAHFPYTWSGHGLHGRYIAQYHYNFAVKRVDRQIGDFLSLLKQNGLLKHSIVVLMSDHGEALELNGDRVTDVSSYISSTDKFSQKIPHFYPPSFNNEPVNRSGGHGTDVLGLSQYHTVLGFRFYGVKSLTPKVIPDIVSLLDIKPTLLNLLGITSPGDDGISLKPLLFSEQGYPKSRGFFLESDFSPQAIHAVYPDKRKLMFETIDYFEINPVTTLITVKKSMGSLIVSSKQYAYLNKEWILALYPQSGGVFEPILINLENGYWTNDLHTRFAKLSPAKQMLSQLQKFYGKELAKLPDSII